MKRLIPLLLIVFFGFTHPAPLSAQWGFPTSNNTDNTQQTISLKDGTILKGQLINITGDKYVIQTQNMGQVEVNTTDLISITTNKKSPSQTPNQTSKSVGSLIGMQMQGMGQMNQIQQQLLTDPDINDSLQKLAQDQEFMDLLKNEDMLKDIFSMDPEKMQNNQELQDLMQNPKMQEIMKKVGQKVNFQQNNLFDPSN